MPLDPAALRRDFPILDIRLHEAGVPLVYLDNAATTQSPKPVVDAMVKAYEGSYANVHRGIHWLSDQATIAYEGAREKVRAFIGAESTDEIIFTRGTTEAINLVARSWGDANVKAGDEILLTLLEHHSNIVPWQQLAARTGALLKYIPIHDDGTLDLSTLDQLLTARTKLLAITAVSNVLGTITPLAELIPKAHAVGAKVLIDAAQSVPHAVTDVRKWDADFVAFSGHKMLAGSGIGVLYGKRALLEAMPPFQGGGSMIHRVELERFTPAELPAKFEAGTPAIVPAIALGAAIDYLGVIGMEAIGEHEHRLTREAHQVLGRIAGLKIHGPSPEKKAGIVNFSLYGANGREIHPQDAAQVLDRGGVAVRAGHHCAMPLHERLGLSASTRASFYLYNTSEEVERLAVGLEKVLHVFRRG